MSDENPSGPSPSQPESPDESARPLIPRMKALSPELRKFLGTPRTREEKAKANPAPEETAQPESSAAKMADNFRPQSTSKPDAPETERKAERRRDEPPRAGGGEENTPERSTSIRRPDGDSNRIFEMRKAILVIGVIFLLGIVFYAGKKIDYWRYLLQTSRAKAKMEQSGKDEYSGLSADELVKQALLAERAGNVKEASQRWMAAKRKDLRYRGILFRVGRMAYDAGDLEGADKLFEKAIEFDENLDTANYFRGLIALHRKDYTGAVRFFEAAAYAGPFVADYPYFRAEALRMDHHPNEAKPFYAHAALLAHTERDDTICNFKIRLARLEAGEGSTVHEEIKERQKGGGALPVDWTLTAAAFAIRDGRPADGVPMIAQARADNTGDLFAICINDFFFVSAAEKNAQLKEAYGADLTPDRQLARPARSGGRALRRGQQQGDQ